MNPIQDPTKLVQLDGQLFDAEQPALLASLPGVLRGEGIFETFVIHDGVPTPLLAQHDKRLAHSAKLTGFDLQLGSLQQSFKNFQPLVKVGNWRVRLTVLRGLNGQQHFLWNAGPEPPPRLDAIVQVSDFRMDPLNPIAGAKTISRLDLQVARAKAQAAGAFEAILRTTDGDLAEGTSSNLFLWSDDALQTPPLDRGILGGVTRQSVIDACLAAKIPVFERKLQLEDLDTAVEVYISNAVIGLVPVAKILERRDSLPGAEGKHLQTLVNAYRDFLTAMSRTPTA
ncbi:MAG: aminotransferase class IV [Planctomycetota bacterium]|nr:aminotransferase class IV [Planctomycetota bacterium]